MRPGTDKSYYIYIEDEGDVYVGTVDEKGVPTLMLDTETDKRLTTDLITEEDTNTSHNQANRKMGMTQKQLAVSPLLTMTEKRLKLVSLT